MEGIMRIEDRVSKLLSEINIEKFKDSNAFVSLGKPNVKATVKLYKKINYLERY